MHKKTLRKLINQYQRDHSKVKRDIQQIEKDLKRKQRNKPNEDMINEEERQAMWAVSGRNTINPQDTYLGDIYGDWVTSATDGIKFARQLCTFDGIRQ